MYFLRHANRQTDRQISRQPYRHTDKLIAILGNFAGGEVTSKISECIRTAKT